MQSQNPHLTSRKLLVSASWLAWHEPESCALGVDEGVCEQIDRTIDLRGQVGLTGPSLFSVYSQSASAGEFSAHSDDTVKNPRLSLSVYRCSYRRRCFPTKTSIEAFEASAAIGLLSTIFSDSDHGRCDSRRVENEAAGEVRNPGAADSSQAGVSIEFVGTINHPRRQRHRVSILRKLQPRNSSIHQEDHLGTFGASQESITRIKT
ncbi:MAG: hypothetical protein GY769_03945 [bacterium]|nr:hypothetical protein [bacterium]